MAISSVLGSSALLPAGLGFRNVLINAEFRINQRGYTSASNLASGSYGFDRWKSTFTNTTLTFTSAPQGQIVTINSGGSIKQVIERENITAGVFVLSWTGTATGRVYNTGATAPSYAASPLVVTLDGLANVEVEFTASGGTRTLWKPQLEQNLQPTPFEQRPIGVELALCQRYYYLHTPSVGNTQKAIGAGIWYTSTQLHVPIKLQTTMRAQPTLVMPSGAGYYVSYQSGTALAISVLNMETGASTTTQVEIYAGGLSGGTAGQISIVRTDNVAGSVAFSAEL